MAIAIMVGCIPAIKALWTTHVTTSTLYARLHSTFSGNQTDSKGLSQFPAVFPESAAGMRGAQVLGQKHVYVELDERNKFQGLDEVTV